MNPDYISLVLFAIMAVHFLFIGLKGVVAKKPFLVSDWWLVPLFLYVTWSLLKDLTGDPFSWVVVLALWVSVAIAFGLFRSSLGYRVYGATYRSVREGLLAALTKLNLSYEETPTGLRLPTIGADLVIGWGPYVKLKQWRCGRVLRDIAKGMNEYYQNNKEVEIVSMKPFVVWLVIGGFFALLTLLGFGSVL